MSGRSKFVQKGLGAALYWKPSDVPLVELEEELKVELLSMVWKGRYRSASVLERSQYRIQCGSPVGVQISVSAGRIRGLEGACVVIGELVPDVHMNGFDPGQI